MIEQNDTYGTHFSGGTYVRGWYIAGKYGRTSVNTASSPPKTMALKTSAVAKVLVDALAALLISDVELLLDL